jgi:hypothetical protein
MVFAETEKRKVGALLPVSGGPSRIGKSKCTDCFLARGIANRLEVDVPPFLHAGAKTAMRQTDDKDRRSLYET